MRLDVELQTGELAGLARAAGRDLGFAAIVAATRTAGTLARQTLPPVLGARIDRPTRFTLNALRSVPATREAGAAEVRFKDIGFTRHYLTYLEEGEPRRAKRFEARLRYAGRLLAGQFLVPGDAGTGVELDAHGNPSRGVYPTILADLQASGDAAANSTAASRARRRKRRKRSARLNGTFFMVNRALGGDRRPGLPDGIYEKKPDGEMNLWFHVVTGPPRYRAVLGLRAAAQAAVPAEFNRQFAIAAGERLARRLVR